MKNVQTELVYAVAMVVVLLGLAAYVAWRQWLALRNLDRLGPEERQYQRAQAWRRLASAGLMVVLAGLLITSYGLGQEERARELGRQGEARGDADRPPPNEADKRFLNQYLLFWSSFIAILLMLVALAFADLWAIRRFGQRQLRQIRADRRAMIEHQVAEIRRQRNGQ